MESPRGTNTEARFKEHDYLVNVESVYSETNSPSPTYRRTRFSPLKSSEARLALSS